MRTSQSWLTMAIVSLHDAASNAARALTGEESRQEVFAVKARERVIDALQQITKAMCYTACEADLAPREAKAEHCIAQNLEFVKQIAEMRGLMRDAAEQCHEHDVGLPLRFHAYVNEQDDQQEES